MKTILLLDSSPRGDASCSRDAAMAVASRLQARNPGAGLLRRDLAGSPPPLLDCDYADALHVSADDHSALQIAALAHSEMLIGELEHTDALVIGTPLHNYTLPAVLKAWVDQVVRINRTFHMTPQGKQGRLQDRPTYIVVSAGARLTGDNLRQPDFLTPYLQTILGVVGIRDITFLYLEGVKADAASRSRADAYARAWIDQHLPFLESA